MAFGIYGHKNEQKDKFQELNKHDRINCSIIKTLEHPPLDKKTPVISSTYFAS